MAKEYRKYEGNDSWRSLYPFESNAVTVGGHRYHYIDEGRGPVLLMVHGNPTWSFYWRELVRGFRGDYRVVVPDHIGCGLSDKPSTEEYSYCLSQRISDLIKLIEHLDLKDITLIAHDWGGAIGMGAAVSMPDRFSRFVLMNTAAFRSEKIPLRIAVCRVPIFGKLCVQGLNLFARAAVNMASCHPDRMTKVVRSGLLAPYDSWKNRVAVHQFVLDIPLDPNHRSYQTLVDVEAGLEKFRRHPVCLIWGMRDWCFTPSFQGRFCEFFPNAYVHCFADAGHYVVEDAHERIVPIIRQFTTEPSTRE